MPDTLASSTMTAFTLPTVNRASARLFGGKPLVPCSVTRNGESICLTLSSGHSFVVTPTWCNGRGSISTDAFGMVDVPGFRQAINGVQSMLVALAAGGADLSQAVVRLALERTIRDLVLDYEDDEAGVVEAAALVAPIPSEMPDPSREAVVHLSFTGEVDERVTAYVAPSGESVGLQLADGRILRPWITFEVSAGSDDERDPPVIVSFDQLCRLGIVLNMPDRIEVEIDETEVEVNET